VLVERGALDRNVAIMAGAAAAACRQFHSEIVVDR
jgi:hypothetical protein